MVDFQASSTVVLALRIVQIIFAIVVLGLTAFVASWFDGTYYYGYYYTLSIPTVDYAIFTSVWTLLALIFLVLVPWRFSDTQANHRFAILAVEAVTMLFWFAAFIALAVFSNSPCMLGVCQASKAATVFAAFEWLAFAFTTAFSALHVARNRGGSKQANPNLNVHERA